MMQIWREFSHSPFLALCLSNILLNSSCCFKKKQQHYQRCICTNVLQKKTFSYIKSKRKNSYSPIKISKMYSDVGNAFPPTNDRGGRTLHRPNQPAPLLFWKAERQGANGQQPGTVKALLSHMDPFKSFRSLGNEAGLPGTCILTKPPRQPWLNSPGQVSGDWTRNFRNASFSTKGQEMT